MLKSWPNILTDDRGRRNAPRVPLENVRIALGEDPWEAAGLLLEMAFSECLDGGAADTVFTSSISGGIATTFP